MAIFKKKSGLQDVSGLLGIKIRRTDFFKKTPAKNLFSDFPYGFQNQKPFAGNKSRITLS